MKRLVFLLMFASLGGGSLFAGQPPTVNLVSPPVDTVVFEGDTLQLVGRAFDPESAITKVEFYVGGTLLGEDLTPPFTTQWTSPGQGIYTLRAVAEDNEGLRATSMVTTVRVTPPTSGRSLHWNPSWQAGPPYWPAPPLEWNHSVAHWQGPDSQPTVFHSGDSVEIGSPSLFIGSSGVPMPVSPSRTILRGTGTLQGGDILAGGLVLEAGARIVFSGYSQSLSFPGGTLLRYWPGGEPLTFDASAAPFGAKVHFGTGPITNEGTVFQFYTSEFGTTLENDFVIPTAGSRISINRGPSPSARAPDAVAYFSGTLYLGSSLDFDVYSDVTPSIRPPHQWIGPVLLDQSRTQGLALVVSGSMPSRTVVFSGGISDGPGKGTNSLWLSGAYAPLRLVGSNTYAHGTRVAGSVEVGPESSLGTGNVQLSNNGTLTLLGSRNIASNASVIIQSGRIVLGTGVKNRLQFLTMGGVTYTNGLFTGTNRPTFFSSNGTFRLPPVNLTPTVTFTQPLGGATFVPGETVTVRAQVSDGDSYITKVEFHVNNTLLAVSTNAPYQVFFGDVPGGVYRLQALAYDDDGGVGFSAIMTINVPLRIDRIAMSATNKVVLEFDAPLFSPYAIEATDTPSVSPWSNLITFPAEPTPGRVRFTNVITEELPRRFYRLALP